MKEAHLLKVIWAPNTLIEMFKDILNEYLIYELFYSRKIS